MKFSHCTECRDEVVWYAVVVNVCQMIFKGSLGIITGSAALVADAFHSSADVIASSVTVLSLKVSKKPPDEEHAYGHGKIQFISSSVVGLILISGALLLMVESLYKVMEGAYGPPSRLALVGAAVSILVNELMYRYQGCVANELNSPAIMANAWDNRSDAMTSVGVFIGIIFATFGYPIADPLAAVGMSLLVMRIGFGLNVEAVRGLMDAMPDREELETIYRTAKSAPGVLGIAYLRARTLGESMQVDINVRVDANLKVYEGDLIVDVLRQKIITALDNENCEIQVYLTPLEASQL